MRSNSHSGEETAATQHFIESQLPDVDISLCTLSEKYDGVNATWDGHALVSRSGNAFAAPEWFTAGLPSHSLTGELWAGRGRFQDTVSIVRSRASYERWRTLNFMIFDTSDALPPSPYARSIAQYPCHTIAHIAKCFEHVVGNGGEGLMIRDPDGFCHKLKPEADDDAMIIGYMPSKNRNGIASLVVRDRIGSEFRLGSGLSDADRCSPPELGEVVKFTHQGRTTRGVPRFARYIGRRAETCLV